MVQEADAIATIVVKENGKIFTDARNEVIYAAEFFRWFSEEAVRINGEFRPAPSGDKRFLVTQQPIGVSLLITPWNLSGCNGDAKDWTGTRCWLHHNLEASNRDSSYCSCGSRYPATSRRT